MAIQCMVLAHFGNLNSNKMKNSNFLKLNVNDLTKGLVVAFISTALVSLVDILNAGQLPGAAELKVAVSVGLAAAASYLLKNLLTNSQGNLFKSE